jgi:hypothetical protein
MILERLDLAALDATGWELKDEGACRADVCVPLPAERTLEAVADRLGMPLLHDGDHGVWALGPATVTGRALIDANAPDLTLPDLAGNPFRLASLRGQKVLLVAWASW